MNRHDANPTSDGDRRVWVLLAFDPATALATRPVGAAGVEADRWRVSWVPLDPAADQWQQRLHPDVASTPVPERLTWWAEHANGVTAALVAVAPPPAADLAQAVEAVVDVLLCHEARW